jgi:bacterioferritin-associated ferredoxin
MYVCVCKAVTDRDIKRAVNEGASTVAEVMECTGAGTSCGTCIAEIAEVVEDKKGPATISRRILPIAPSSNAA